MKLYLAFLSLLIISAIVKGDFVADFERAIGARYSCADTTPANLPERRSGFSYVAKARLCVDNSFTKAQFDLLLRAFDEMQERLVNPRVYSCYRAATPLLAIASRNSESFAEFLDRFVVASIGGSVLGLSLEPAYVFISAEKNPDASWGKFIGRAPLFNDSAFSPYRSGLKRVLAFRVGDTVLGARDLPFGTEVSYWAAALGMALLQEAGVSSDSLNPANSPLYEIGKCLLWEGKVPKEFRTGELWK